MPVPQNIQAHKRQRDSRNENQQQLTTDTIFPFSDSVCSFFQIQLFSACYTEWEAWKLHMAAGVLLGCSKGKHWCKIKGEQERAEAGNHTDCRCRNFRAATTMPPAGSQEQSGNRPSSQTLLAPLQSNTSLNLSLPETSKWLVFFWLDWYPQRLKTLELLDPHFKLCLLCSKISLKKSSSNSKF